MFYLYKRATRAHRLAIDLRVSRNYPYENRVIVRRSHRTMRQHVNWGCSYLSNSIDSADNVLNFNIGNAISKIAAFQCFEQCGIPHPYVFENANAAQQSGDAFLGRRDGLSGGRGIIIYEAGAMPAQHDFYTRIINTRREFRFHVFQGDIIAIQKKLLSNATSIIHNHDNGVIFQHYEQERFNIGERTTAAIKEMAVAAVEAVGVHFGAVDIIQEWGTNKLFVLEVNTAPGITSEPVYNAYLRKIGELVLP